MHTGPLKLAVLLMLFACSTLHTAQKEPFKLWHFAKTGTMLLQMFLVLGTMMFIPPLVHSLTSSLIADAGKTESSLGSGDFGNWKVGMQQGFHMFACETGKDVNLLLCLFRWGIEWNNSQKTSNSLHVSNIVLLIPVYDRKSLLSL